MSVLSITICICWRLLLSSLFLAAFIWICLRTVYRRSLQSANHQRRKSLLNTLGYTDAEKKRVVGFFHPYCNAGGGGERVLWTAIAGMQRTDPDIVSVVYSGDVDATKEEIIAKVKSRFNIELDPTLLHFVFLRSRYLVEDSAWPRFTLLGQSLGSMRLAWEAMHQLIPDLYIDTMGYAFTFHIVSLLGKIPIGAYVHYPTISTDMLARVESRKKWHTNTDAISSSIILSRIKLLYYRLFMYYYAHSLRACNFIMVNSSWTKNHVDSILNHSDTLMDALHPLLAFKSLMTKNAPEHARIVYPPCDTSEMAQFPLLPRERIVLSVAQFRPEKDHKEQLNAFHLLLEKFPEYKGEGGKGVKLVVVGGSRNEGDANRVAELRKQAQELGIEPYTDFIINASYPIVLDLLSKASIGLSTMVDEHFGINVVEFMAAGVIPIAHASGGPLKDIIVPFNGEPTGFHARTTQEFADAMHTVLSLNPEEESGMRWRARAWAVQRFSEEEFERGWNESGWRLWLTSPRKVE
ncbi:GDP-Man:Man(3)GlcNAc(2)-PP-Dol alpha-1,2-mannosyltransferase [Psilocybe cubensis]|uniref:GDP-Man:Man(3)GlcNAc(2)-PP-Dol alpha-1,2-mannosyltransferase n=2 Tax=Psilocybe cubensis TaxID=181762 RepID=A0ACB8GXT2_PSICU|nr:GDP-Man:Man(3)GlcNAc(2)-PP-Dol alpha-1,2-mannosyltransferase [Psilocybe cubensis]KAH9480376.1 GDP-Man:Man(3)GlcNAc(2)-PP-Dol alpha-1,2-mannosyltransferase [Psilocybe cubensis]